MKEPALLQVLHEPISENPLVRDYLAQQGEAPSFFVGAPFSLESLRQKLSEVTQRFGRTERERAARALRPTSEGARVRLERFVAEGGAMVTTGQQAGLFTGPLYTIHKALTTLRLADHLQEALDTPVVPVFWVASEDHDWDEVNHAFLGVPQNGLRKLALESERSAPVPMGEQRLGEDIERILEEVRQSLAGAPFEQDVMNLVQDAYTPDRTVAGAFSHLLGSLFSGFDLCLTDARDPVVKRASAPILERALTESDEHERMLAERTAALEACGYTPQVVVLEGATNLFRHDRGRARLYRDGEGFAIPETGARVGLEELLGELHESPERFSPNVLLRPIVESGVFPTLAYVGGPGEISYFAQASALFPSFGMVPPVIHPRGSVTLIELPMQRLLEKLEFTVAELGRPQHELVEELARRSMPEEIGSAVEGLDRVVREGYARLIELAGGIDPTLVDALGSLRNQVLSKIGDSERKVIRQLKRREEITVAQLERVRANVRPDGNPQDRVLNVLPFLSRHGSGLLEEVARHLGPRIE